MFVLFLCCFCCEYKWKKVLIKDNSAHHILAGSLSLLFFKFISCIVVIIKDRSFLCLLLIKVMARAFSSCFFITDSTRASTLIFFLAGPGWNIAITILHQHVPCFYQSSHNLMIPVFWGTEIFQSMIKWGITNGGELLIFSSGKVFSNRLTQMLGM